MTDEQRGRVSKAIEAARMDITSSKDAAAALVHLDALADTFLNAGLIDKELEFADAIKLLVEKHGLAKGAIAAAEGLDELLMEAEYMTAQTRDFFEDADRSYFEMLEMLSAWVEPEEAE